jgi:hypothetical protein
MVWKTSSCFAQILEDKNNNRLLAEVGNREQGTGNREQGTGNRD